MSDAQIRALGRWKSNAFLKYIRIPLLSTESVFSMELLHSLRGKLCMGSLKVMGLNSKGSSPIIFQYLYAKEYGVLISKGSSSP